MKRLSFRVDEAQAIEADRWARQLRVHRSELLREALRAHLLRLAAERDADVGEGQPPMTEERALSAVAGWGPVEDWSDWSDAAR